MRKGRTVEAERQGRGSPGERLPFSRGSLRPDPGLVQGWVGRAALGLHQSRVPFRTRCEGLILGETDIPRIH